MPDWLEEIAKDIARYGVKGSGNRRGGGGGSRFAGNGGGGSRFGGRDHRVQYNGSGTSNGNQRGSHAFGGNNAFANNSSSFSNNNTAGTGWNNGSYNAQPQRSVPTAFGNGNTTNGNAVPAQRQQNPNQKVFL